MTIEWNEPQTQLLKRLWIAGEAARLIAEKLGGSVTRNAVIGKAHRLGLTGKHGSKGRGLGRPPASTPANQQVQQKSKLKNRRR